MNIFLKFPIRSFYYFVSLTTTTTTTTMNQPTIYLPKNREEEIQLK